MQNWRRWGLAIAMVVLGMQAWGAWADDPCREALEAGKKFAITLDKALERRKVTLMDVGSFSVRNDGQGYLVTYTLRDGKSVQERYPYNSRGAGDTYEIQVAGPTVLFVKHAQGNSISCTIMVSIVPTFPRVRAEIPDPHKMIGPMQQPQAQAPRTSPEGALPAATAPATNEGARAVAWSLYNKRIQRCGDSWFAMADHGAFGRYRIEIKDLTFNINSSPMTDVDKANGIEWKGGARAGGKMFRYHQNGQW